FARIARSGSSSARSTAVQAAAETTILGRAAAMVWAMFCGRSRSISGRPKVTSSMSSRWAQRCLRAVTTCPSVPVTSIFKDVPGRLLRPASPLESLLGIAQRRPPPRVIDEPGYGLGDPRFEGLLRLPTKLRSDLGRVNRITPVVARSVGHEGNLLAIGFSVCARFLLVQNIADRFYDAQVRALVVAADIVRLANFAGGDHQRQRPRMVVDVKPIADILAPAIDRQFTPIQRTQGHKRNELFGEVVWPVIVRAVGDQDRQTIGVMPCTHKMVGCSLRC